MFDLNKEAQRAYSNADRRGFPLDGRSINKHLQSEVVELLSADRMKNSNDLQRISGIRCDNDFLKAYSKHQKNTDVGELMDILTVCLTKCHVLNFNIEAAFNNCQRANSLRVD